MYTNTSAAFDAAIRKSGQIVCSKLILTLQNGTVHELTDNDFIGKSLEIEKSCFPNSVFELGGTVSKTISFSLNNHDKRWDNVSFKNAKVEAFSGLVLDGVSEYVPLGTFYIDGAGKPLDTVQISGVDSILKLEKSYSQSTLTYPATIQQILEEIASKCGVSLTSSDIFNGSYTVTEEPDKASFTFRDILSFVASIAGGFARITRNNELEIIQIAENAESPYIISPDFRISCKTDYMVNITGLAYYGELENRLFGSDEYPLILDNNPLIDNMTTANQTAVLESLYNLYNGFTYIPFEGEFPGDPRLDEGDYIQLTDTRDGTVGTYIFRYSFTNGATEKIEAPVCDELDKNFLDANKKKQEDTKEKINVAYNNSAGGGGSDNSTYTHDEYADLGKPTSTYANLTGLPRTSFAIAPTMDGEVLPYDWYCVAYARSKNVEPYSGILNVEVHTAGEADTNGQIQYTSGGLNSSNSRDLCPYVEFKFYTTEEYQKLYKQFNEDLNTVDRWPVLHASTPTQMDNQSKNGTVVNIEVSSEAIVNIDHYYNVREYQLAQFIFNMFFTLNLNGFMDYFKNAEDVYRYLQAFRVPVDSQNIWNGGTEGGTDNEGTGDGGDSGSGGTEEGGEVLTGFTNPLPDIISGDPMVRLPSGWDYSNGGGNIQFYYVYTGDTDPATIDLTYYYNGEELLEAYYSIDLSAVSYTSPTTFTWQVVPNEENAVYQAITAITFTFDTVNNKVLITHQFSTSDVVLNALLSQTIEIS